MCFMNTGFHIFYVIKKKKCIQYELPKREYITCIYTCICTHIYKQTSFILHPIVSIILVCTMKEEHSVEDLSPVYWSYYLRWIAL